MITVAALVVVLAVSCQTSPPATNTEAPGERLYAANCATCHGPSGNGLGDYPTIVGKADILNGDYARTLIAEGRNLMPAFGATLTPEQIDEIVEYVKTFG